MMFVLATTTEMSLMQKFIQLLNILFVMTKDFPSFSNLRAVLFCLQWWLEQVFLSLWHLAGRTGSHFSGLFSPFTLQNREVIGSWACFVFQRSLSIETVAFLVSDEDLWLLEVIKSNEITLDTLQDVGILQGYDPRLS